MVDVCTVRCMQRLQTRLTTWGAVAAVLGGMVAMAAVGPAGCSFIRFEEGPYVVRDLEVVYSQQEDMTFLVWRLREDADRDLVEFELYRNGEYRPIDLEETPYPAEPYGCNGDKICFQYQIPGEYDVPDGRSPVRSRHDTEGIYAGPDPEVSKAETTFDVSPVAVDNNRRIHPQRYSWFREQDVPLRRDYQWRLIDHESGECQADDPTDWGTMATSVDVDYGWVEQSHCFASRPVIRKGRAVRVHETLPPSAETTFEHQTYEPERLEPPIVYGIVFDLSIPSKDRCKQVKETLLRRLRTSIQAQGTHRELGIYKPRSSKTGKPLGGCKQEPRRRLPLADMVNDARRAKATISPPEVKVLWVYANNISLPPKKDVGRQLQEWTTQLGPKNNLKFFHWGIGSNTILQLGSWDYRTGWRPIEDDTFQGDIKSFAKNYLPFETMDHDDTTEVPIDHVEGVDEPKAFKICQSTPFPVDSIGTRSGSAPYGVDSPHVPWPDSGKPFYRVALPEQHLVPHQRYRIHQIDIVVEVCERFCDHQFKTRGGTVYENWKKTPDPRPLEVCQWRK